MALAADVFVLAVHFSVVHVLPKRVVHVPVPVPGLAFSSRPHSSVLPRVNFTFGAMHVYLMDSTGLHVTVHVSCLMSYVIG
jgi:hypothetical protein